MYFQKKKNKKKKKSKLSSAKNVNTFQFTNVLNKHAPPKQKFLRSNQAELCCHYYVAVRIAKSISEKKKSDYLKTRRYEAAKKLRWESLASWKEYFEHNDLMLVIIKCFESQLHLFFLNKSQKGDNLTLTEVTKVINDDEKCPDTFNSYFNSYFYWYKWSCLSNHWKIQETFKYC